MASAAPHRSLGQPPSRACAQGHSLASRTSLPLLFPGNLPSPDGIFLKAPDPKPLPFPPLQPLVPPLPPVWSGGCWRQGLGALSRCKGHGGQQGEREDAPRPARAVEKGAEGEQAAVFSTSAGGDGLSPARVHHQKMSGKGRRRQRLQRKSCFPLPGRPPAPSPRHSHAAATVTWMGREAEPPRSSPVPSSST